MKSLHARLILKKEQFIRDTLRGVRIAGLSRDTTKDFWSVD